MITMPPGTSTQGASATARISCASDSDTPQLMAGARRPRPKKLREVSAMMIPGILNVVEAMMWLYEGGYHVAEYDAKLTGPIELGRYDEVLLTHGQEAPPDLPGKGGPAYEGYDDGYGEVDP